MNTMTYFHKQFPKQIQAGELQMSQKEAYDFAIRAMPGQKRDSQMHPFGVQTPDLQRYMIQYAVSPWVYTAVSRLAEAAASAVLNVVDRNDSMKRFDDHPLLAMVGKYGMADESTDASEFWENHWTQFDLMGNVYWFWSGRGAAPDEVFLLNPWQVRVIPGTSATVRNYEYWYFDQRIPLPAENVTHFRKPNPFNRYNGLAAMEALSVALFGDRAMERWNVDLFGDGVTIPGGVVVLPDDTTDEQMKTIENDFTAKHEGTRKTAFIRGKPGTAVYLNAGLAQKEMDFVEGRKLTRQMVFDALGLPVGLMSEASTEAHARVAERQLLNTIHRRLTKAARKLTGDALGFWPMSQARACEFEDIRQEAADWEQLERRIRASAPFMKKNEVRTNILNLQEDEEFNDAGSTDDQSLEDARQRLTTGGGDSDSVQRERQVRDVVE